MPDLIYNVKFQIDDSQFQKESAGIERYKQEVEEANAEIAELKAQLNGAIAKSREFSNTSKQTQGSTKRMNVSFSTANQSLFALSDGFQDAAQFQQGFGVGMRAIGNNVGFASELFLNLNRRIKEHNAALEAQVAAGRMSVATMQAQSTTMRSQLIRSLKGPGGLLIAINLVVTAITVFSNSLRNNTEAAQEAAEGIGEYTDTLDTLRGLVTPELSQLQGLREERTELEEVIELVEERNKLETDLQGIRNQQVPITSPGGVPFQSNVESLTGLIDRQAKTVDAIKRFNIAIYRNPIQTAGRDIDDLNSALDELNMTIDTILDSSEDLRLQLGFTADELTTSTGMAITKFELGLRNSEQALRDQIEENEAYIDVYKQLANQLSTTTKQQNTYATFLKLIVKQNEAAKKALGETNDALGEQRDEYAELKALLGALQIEENSTLEVTSVAREEFISQVKEEIEQVQESNLALEERVQKLKTLLGMLEQLEGQRDDDQGLDEYAQLKTLLNALRIEENALLEVTSATTEDVISQVIREMTAVRLSNMALDEKVEKLDELSSILQELKELGSDGIFGEIQEDIDKFIKNFNERIVEDYKSEVERQMAEATQARLDEISKRQKMQREVAEQLARDEIKLEEEKFSTKMDIARSATQAIASLGRALAGDSKAAAIAFLAVEQGLRVAQVAMNTTQTISQLTQDAFAASSKARAAYAATPALANIMAATAAAPIRAQIPLAKKSGAAAIAAILAQTIGRGASILSSDGGGDAAAGGGASPSRGVIEAGFSEADEPLAYNPRVGMRSGPNQKTIVNFNVDETGFAFNVQGADGVAGANTLNMTSSDA